VKTQGSDTKLVAQMQPGDGLEKLEKVIEELKKEDHQFHMDGGST
jgi:hypothetical protein